MALFVLALALLSACGATSTESALVAEQIGAQPAPTAGAPAPRVTPAAIFSQLSSVTTLQEAAAQFASALQIEVASVRVRLNTGACTTCSISEYQQNTSLAGLSVADAASRVAAGNQVYLAVSRFVCTYDFDGRTFTPRECRFTPL